MAIEHTKAAEPVDVRPLGIRLSTQKSVALFKAGGLEVIRLVLLAGKSLPPHKVAGDITIHCLEGRLCIAAEGASHVLNAGELLFLRGDVVHDVTAVEDSSALMTIALMPSR